MITIHGTGKKEGIAIAVAAVVDARAGLGSVSPALLQSGVDALKRRLAPQDYPEAVIVCESLAMGLAARIPGVRGVGVAAQDEQDLPGVDIATPCVIGLRELLKSVHEGDIVIVDGARGVAHIDPDPSTLTRYQRMEEQRHARAPVFIASAHLPARTQQGETVLVYAFAADDRALDRALDEGADGALIDIRGGETRSQDDFTRLLVSCLGKKAALLVDYLPREVLHALVRLDAPQTIGVVFSSIEDLETRVRDAEESVEAVSTEAFLQGLKPPSVRFGVLAAESESELVRAFESACIIALDMRESAHLRGEGRELQERLSGWLAGKRLAEAVVVLGRQVEAIGPAVAAGARAIAVEPELVGAAKHAIRCAGLEENE